MASDNKTDFTVALAGNPNVGKSTVFNQLTGMNQHTGNWPGKTVTNAQGIFTYEDKTYLLVDIPGTYSLMAHSAEEEVARDFICFGGADCVIVVCDAVCLERNLNLALQITEITKNIILCINLMDEAKKKHISVNLNKLSQLSGVTVVGTTASKGEGLENLLEAVSNVCRSKQSGGLTLVEYDDVIERAIKIVKPTISKHLSYDAPEKAINERWLSLQLLDSEQGQNYPVTAFAEVSEAVNQARVSLADNGFSSLAFRDSIIKSLVKKAEELCSEVVVFEKSDYNLTDRKIDSILTSKRWGFPIMILFFALIFWLTIIGSNYPTTLLSRLSSLGQEKLLDLFHYFDAPEWLSGILIFGIYRVTAWVVSVMLPPMAIFFPLFTLLEDLGYLPRIAFNLDYYFKKCSACGKQALTMCMN